jgi:hypothetical protein
MAKSKGKSAKGAQKGTEKKLSVKKQAIKDLDASSKGKDVKGGARLRR